MNNQLDQSSSILSIGQPDIFTDEHLTALTGNLWHKRAMTIALLQDRQAMLTNPRTEVVQLKRALLELNSSVE